MSLAFPAASLAMGLGDIHVTSALHQPLVAQIELIGATPEDLVALRPRIPDDEEFRLRGIERPSFLSASTLTLGKDAQGNPVLLLQSSGRANEPLVSVLVGLESPDGKFVREYTVLLDPVDRLAVPGEATAASTAVAVAANASLPAASTPDESTPTGVAPARASEPAPRQAPRRGRGPVSQRYTVAPRDTLNHIARSAGARSASELRHMAIAIYHANPDAFRSNLNLLRSGATLMLPAAEQLSAISAQDADREYADQMKAWRADAHRIAAAVPRTSPVNVPQALDSGTRGGESDEAQIRNLAEHVQALERSLNELQQQLKRPPALPAVGATVANTAVASTPARDPALPLSGAVSPVAAEDSYAASEGRATAKPRAALLAAIAVCAALVLAAGSWFRRRRQAAQTPSGGPRAAHQPLREIAKEQAKVADVAPVPRRAAAPSAASLARSGEASWFRAPIGSMEDRSSANTPSASTLVSAPEVQPAPAPLPVAETAEIPARIAGPTSDTEEMPALIAHSTTDTEEMPVARSVTDTEEMPAPLGGPDATGKFTFFNPQSLEDTTHVVMTSDIKQAAPFIERRKNPADVLGQAIEREPHRGDLRLKLLELYYAGAAQNRRAFLDTVRELVKKDGLVSPEQWARITHMGRAIAPDEDLFSYDEDSKAVA